MEHLKNSRVSILQRLTFVVFIILCVHISQVNSAYYQSDNTLAVKVESQLIRCDSLMTNKRYQPLVELALEVIQNTTKLNDEVLKIEGLYYMARGSYYLREIEQGKYYGTIGLGLARKNGIKHREAYFNNLLGIISRRMDDCPEAINYYNDAIAINKEIKDSLQLGRNYNNLSICLQQTGQREAAIASLEMGLDIREKMKDTIGMANIYMNLGNGYEEINSFQKAIENYLTAYDMYNEIGQETRKTQALFNIGLVYQDLDDFQNALKYYEDAREKSLAQEMNSLTGIIYQNMGNVRKKQGEYARAIEDMNMALNTFEEINDLGRINDANLNLGLLYLDISEMTLAEKYLLKSYQISKDNPGSYDFANVNIELGHLYTLKNEYVKAQEFLDEGMEIAKERQDLTLESYGHKYLYDLADETNDIKSALFHYKAYRMKDDSLNILDQEKTITRIKNEYDFAKKETEIELLNTENELKEAEVAKGKEEKKLFYAIMGLMGVIIGGVTFLFGYSKRKNKSLTIEKTKAQDLLLNILPKEAADEIQEKGFVTAKRLNNANVLFTDFVKFSSYAEDKNPEEVVYTLDYYFKNFDKIMDKYNIEKIKTIGDAYMCANGLDGSSTAADDIVKAGKEILSFTKHVLESPPEGIHPFSIRIGIHSGPVVAGIVGTKKFQYDIWGDTVNIAARLENHSEENTINISEATYKLIKGKHQVKFNSELEVKNRGKVNSYFIV